MGADRASLLDADYHTEAVLAADITWPTATAIAPDGRIFVSEQIGTLRVIQGDRLLPEPFVTLNVEADGERGLLGIAFDPDFVQNNYIYIYYTVPGTDGAASHNRISRFTANGNVAEPGSEVILVDLDPLDPPTNHNGGAIAFGPDGKLYVAVGDNSYPFRSQSLDTRHGKVLRYNKDGTIPDDNPTAFDGIEGTTSGVNREIWAVGLRNPFTFAIHPETGQMLLNEVGQDRWEEINEVRPGRNFGWPLTEGDFDQAAFPDFTRPVYA